MAPDRVIGRLGHSKRTIFLSITAPNNQRKFFVGSINRQRLLLGNMLDNAPEIRPRRCKAARLGDDGVRAIDRALPDSDALEDSRARIRSSNRRDDHRCR